MIIAAIIAALESWANPFLQEDYDNAGLITGDAGWDCSGIICSLDATEAVVDEAIAKKCNLIVSHHPIVFRPLKKFSGRSYIERTIIKAIKNDIAVYAIHTNLDNVLSGVNGAMAKAIGLDEKSLSVLAPKQNTLSKLYTYVPLNHAEDIKNALFEAGAGTIGAYAECSFTTHGSGSFKPLPGSKPFIGTEGGKRELVDEVKIEMVFPVFKSGQILKALFKAHPYEEVAYEIIPLQNQDKYTGSGLVGELPNAISEQELLHLVKKAFGLTALRHTPLLNHPIKKIALCGGAGSFLIKHAIQAKADVYLTADVKYHEFFDAGGEILLLDIGHWESEQFTIDLLANFLQVKFPTFAVLKTEVNTNPVHNFI